MEKISENFVVAELPDVSEENNCGENFASAFANNQFGREQTASRKRLHEGKNRALKRLSPQAADQARRPRQNRRYGEEARRSRRSDETESKETGFETGQLMPERRAQPRVCMPANANGYRRNQDEYVPGIFSRPRSSLC